jgi:L1 cell adhesion molecule like protein
MAKRESPAIGIDLGTACSRVGMWREGRVEIIADDRGNSTTPSYVAFDDTDRLIRDAAKKQVDMNPANTVFGTCHISDALLFAFLQFGLWTWITRGLV